MMNQVESTKARDGEIFGGSVSDAKISPSCARMAPPLSNRGEQKR